MSSSCVDTFALTSAALSLMDALAESLRLSSLPDSQWEDSDFESHKSLAVTLDEARRIVEAHGTVSPC